MVRSTWRYACLISILDRGFFQRRSRPVILFYGDLSSDPTLPASMCVMAFKGNYAKGAVDKPLGRATGALAVVVTSSSGNTLVGTVIFRSVPLALGHPHVG